MKKKRASSSIEPILIRFLFRIFRHFSLYFEFRKYLASLSFVSHFIRARLESVQISPYEFSTDARPLFCVRGREREAWRKFWSVELRAPFWIYVTRTGVSRMAWSVAEPGSFWNRNVANFPPNLPLWSSATHNVYAI